MQSIARRTIGRANVAREKGDFLKSLQLADESTILFQEENDPAGMAEAQAVKLLTFRHLFQKTSNRNYLILAKHAAMSAVEIAEGSGNPKSLALPYFNLARAYGEHGDYKEAVKYYHKAVESIVKNPPASHARPGVTADFKIHLAEAEYFAGDKSAQGRLEKAIEELRNSDEKKVSDYNYNVWLSGAYIEMARMLQKDDPKKAKEALKMAKEIIDSDSRLTLRQEQWKKVAETIG